MTFQYYASHPGVTNPEEHRVKYIIENDIRLMISAEHWGYPFTRYAVDNGAWTDYIKGRQFNHMRFLKVLEKIKQQETQPDFIVLPDIVRGGLKSFELSKSYLDVADNHPCYFSIQDGITPEMITPDIIEAVNGFFIGGSNVWKWRVMNEWVTFAHEHRKKNTRGENWNASGFSEMLNGLSRFCRRLNTYQTSPGKRHRPIYGDCQRTKTYGGGINDRNYRNRG